MSTARTRITFAQFGMNFMDLVVTSARINDSLAEFIRKVPADELSGTKSIEGNEVRFRAALDHPQTERTMLDWALRFTVALPMAVGIEVLAIPDHPKYSLRVVATFDLLVTTCSPLLVVVEPVPITADSVAVMVEAKDEGFLTWVVGVFKGNIEEKVIAGVRQTVAEVISKAIANAGDALTYDIEEKAHAALNHADRVLRR